MTPSTVWSHLAQKCSFDHFIALNTPKEKASYLPASSVYLDCKIQTHGTYTAARSFGENGVTQANSMQISLKSTLTEERIQAGLLHIQNLQNRPYRHTGHPGPGSQVDTLGTRTSRRG